MAFPPLTRHKWATLLAFGYAMALYWCAPIHTAFELHADERYELIKGFLDFSGERLYGSFWNDQPPFHTFLLKCLFSLFGPSAHLGRILSLLFASMMIWLVFDLAWRWSGPVGAFAAIITLVISPGFFLLSVATMIGLPAYAIGLLGLHTFCRYCDCRKVIWLCVSGLCFGLALQTKLTALLLLPALFVWQAMGEVRKMRAILPDGGAKQTLTAWLGAATGRLMGVLGIWTACVLLGVAVVWAGYPQERWSDIVTAHFDSRIRNAFADPTEFFTLHDMLRYNVATVLAALVGMILAMLNWRAEYAVPVTLALTTYGAHLIHKPFWHYYYLHLAIPLAWLVGIAFQILWTHALDRSGTARARSPGGIRGVLALALLSSVLLVSFAEKFPQETGFLSRPERGINWKIVSLMKSRAAKTNWVYTDCALFAFYAGLKMPPELAVIPMKRIRAGRITSQELATFLKRYRPEQIVLQRAYLYDHDIDLFLKEFYNLKAGDGSLRYYVSKAIDNS